MSNDAKLGLLVGVGLVITAAVTFSRPELIGPAAGQAMTTPSAAPDGARDREPDARRATYQRPEGDYAPATPARGE